MEPAQLHYSTGVLIVCVGGCSGGFVSAIGAIVEGSRDDSGEFLGTKGVPVPLFILGRCTVGIGGAIAVLLASLSVNKFTGSSDIDLLALSALCFVAGSIGHRLLPMVAAQIEKRIGEAERKVEMAVRQVEANQDSVSMNTALMTAMGILARKEQMTAVVNQTIVSLEKFSKEFPTERTLHIVLARMYRFKKNDLDRAILVLQRFIKKKAKKRDKDVADAYFNIACYWSIKAGESNNDELRSKFIVEGQKAIAESVKILPDSAIDAKNDPDLKELQGSEGYEELLAHASSTT